MANTKKVRAVFAGFDRDPTGEDLAQLYRMLTGEESTPEQIAEMQRKLDEPTA